VGEESAARLARARTDRVRVLPGETVLAVRGADARSFLHRMLTRDVKGLATGSAVRALLLTPKGRIRAILLCAAVDDGFLLASAAAGAASLREALQRSVIADDVSIADTGWFVTSVVGPTAAAAVASAASAVAPPENAPAAEPPKGAHVVASTRFRLPSLEVFAAAPWEVPGLATLDAADAAALRVEQGEPAFGAEAGEETLPQECGLEDRVDFAKGCFPGQEPVARLRTRGHTNRGLAGILLPAGAPLPAPGDPVLHGERAVGAVTSAALSPTLGRPVALALLRHEAAAPGTPLAVGPEWARREATAAALPFPGTAAV
jgi:folate-binding protein YgfZ